MNVSIIIPVFNGGEILNLTIPAILNQDYNKGDIEYIIIDDASTDNSLEKIRSFSLDSSIQIVSNKFNKGRAYTRNIGIEKSNGDLLIFIDCDIKVDSQFVSNHVRQHLEKNIVGLFSNINPGDFKYKDKYQRYIIYNKRGAKKCNENQPIPFNYFLIGCTSIKANVINKIGGFNEKINIYGEDLEFSYRLYKLFPDKLYYSKKINVYIYNVKPLNEILLILKQYGQYNVPLLLKEFPELSSYITFDFVRKNKESFRLKTIIGTLLFNSILFYCFKFLLFIIPFPLSNLIIKYLLASSIIIGYRKTIK